MALKAYDEQDIRNIANAIKAKTGNNTAMKVSDMASAIAGIETDSVNLYDNNFRRSNGGSLYANNGQTVEESNGVFTITAEDSGVIRICTVPQAVSDVYTDNYGPVVSINVGEGIKYNVRATSDKIKSMTISYFRTLGSTYRFLTKTTVANDPVNGYVIDTSTLASNTSAFTVQFEIPANTSSYGENIQFSVMVSNGAAPKKFSAYTYSPNIKTQTTKVYYPLKVSQSIPSRTLFVGDSSIDPVVVSSTLSADNIKNGVTVQIGDPSSANRIASVTGTYTGPALTGTATTGHVLAGDTFYNTSSDSKQTGTMVNQGTKTITLTSSAPSYTIPEGYHSGTGVVSVASAVHTSPTARYDNATGKIIATHVQALNSVLTGSAQTTYSLELPTVAGQNIFPKMEVYKLADAGTIITGTVNVAPVINSNLVVSLVTCGSLRSDSTSRLTLASSQNMATTGNLSDYFDIENATLGSGTSSITCNKTGYYNVSGAMIARIPGLTSGNFSMSITYSNPSDNEITFKTFSKTASSSTGGTTQLVNENIFLQEGAVLTFKKTATFPSDAAVMATSPLLELIELTFTYLADE